MHGSQIFTAAIENSRSTNLCHVLLPLTLEVDRVDQSEHRIMAQGFLQNVFDESMGPVFNKVVDIACDLETIFGEVNANCICSEASLEIVFEAFMNVERIAGVKAIRCEQGERIG